MAVVCAMAWVLWPNDFASILENPEPIVAFFVALITWLGTEVVSAEHPSERNEAPSPRVAAGLAENDRRCARRLLTYHRYWFRDLLKEQDLGAYFDYRYMEELHGFNHAVETQGFEFLDLDLSVKWAPVAKELKEFARFMAQNSAPKTLGGREVIRLDPYATAFGMEGVGGISAKSDEGNAIADRAWASFDEFVADLKKTYPAVLDEPIECQWFYSN